MTHNCPHKKSRIEDDPELVMLVIGSGMLFASQNWEQYMSSIELPAEEADCSESFKELHDYIMNFYLEMIAASSKLRTLYAVRSKAGGN